MCDPRETKRSETQVLGDLQLQTLREQGQESALETDEYTFSWQEKVFSKREQELYANESNCLTMLEKTYHHKLLQMRKQGLPTRRLFSYVQADPFTSSLDSTTGEPSPFAKQRDVHLNPARESGGISSALTNLLFRRRQKSDSRPQCDELAPRGLPSSRTEERMAIMVDLSPAHEPQGELQDEMVLCIITYNPKGVVSVYPDFCASDKPYVLEGTRSGTYRFTVHHASNQVKGQELGHTHGKTSPTVPVHHKEIIGSFDMVPPKVLRLFVCGEIVSTKDFKVDDLFIRYLVDLPHGWSIADKSQAYGATEICRTGLEADVAFFGYPFGFELTSHLDGASKAWPRLYFHILSRDWFKIHRTLGYAHLSLPDRPGSLVRQLTAWCPISDGTKSELRSFFIGGCTELEDIALVSVSPQEESPVSKFGLRTQTSGTITLRLNTVFQSQEYLSERRSTDNLAAHPGTSALEQSVAAVLEAFKRARQRMIAAREGI